MPETFKKAPCNAAGAHESEQCQQELEDILTSCGFKEVKSTSLFNGIVAIHTGYKI